VTRKIGKKPPRRVHRVAEVAATRRHIGAQLQKHRERCKLRAVDVHQRTGLSVSFIGLLERGERAASTETLVVLGHLYGVPPRVFWL
jgi:hypothetical protein